MDVHDKLDEITRLVEDARAMPMSASALVHREELLELLDELRELMPAQLRDADVLLSDRDAVVAQGREQAEQLLRQAHVERDRLVEETEVVSTARQRAAQVQAHAQTEAARLLAEADDYVDRKLGDFEITLDKLAQQVRRGREHLAERAAADHAAPHPAGEAGAGADAGAERGAAHPDATAVASTVRLPPDRVADEAFDQEDAVRLP